MKHVSDMVIHTIKKPIVNRNFDVPWFDGANCPVGSAPTGTNAFIYGDNFYYSPVGCCDCPLACSNYDGANCKVVDIPSDRIGFVYNNNWCLHPLGDLI